jgi:hypothetical protein
MITLDVHVVEEYYKLKKSLEKGYKAFQAGEIGPAAYQMALDRFNSYCIYAIAKMVGDAEMAEAYKENY